jgi:hypothetical protein
MLGRERHAAELGLRFDDVSRRRLSRTVWDENLGGSLTWTDWAHGHADRFPSAREFHVDFGDLELA